MPNTSLKFLQPYHKGWIRQLFINFHISVCVPSRHDGLTIHPIQSNPLNQNNIKAYHISTFNYSPIILTIILTLNIFLRWFVFVGWDSGTILGTWIPFVSDDLAYNKRVQREGDVE